MDRFDEFLAALQKRDDDKHKNAVMWVLAVIGAVAAVAGIAYAVYRYLTPDYLEDFEEDFDDDFEDFFEDDDEDDEDDEIVEVKPAEPKREETDEE